MSFQLSINSIDFLCKSMDWFLYDKDILYERVKTLFTYHTPKVFPYMSQGRISFFFLYHSFLSQISLFIGKYGKRQIISLIHLSSLPLPPTLQELKTLATLLLQIAHLCTQLAAGLQIQTFGFLLKFAKHHGMHPLNFIL